VTAHLTIDPDDPGLSLALAMVVSSTAPLLLLDGDQKIVAASASFCETFGIAPATIQGRRLHELGSGEWDVPQLRSLVNATASDAAVVPSYEMDLKVAGHPRRLVLNVRKLSYGQPDEMRLLIGVSDVTEARKSDAAQKDLVRQNEILLQEVRHRVANSLQIIASVLMQSARRTQSEETRAHLRDAHQRVMSVAELQQQLAISTLGTVRLRNYLTTLCETISASMIVDAKALSLAVECEDVVVDAGVSVSLGLIVTELVINSLKHGFPDERGGTIVVSYTTNEGGWTLAVRDDGVGMPKADETPAKAGLGTSIIQALAHQLDAEVQVNPAECGAEVTVSFVRPAENEEAMEAEAV
jgi:two-component sensor histidine kinase